VTGAPIPEGADAVLRHEDALVAGDELRAARPPKPGDHIRRRGENARAGAPILAVGQRIHAATTSALATFGVATPCVRRRVRVAIVTTGDELDPIEATPQPWRLRDGNGPALATLLAGRAWLAVDAPRGSIDDEARLRAAFAEALDGADALLVTGGVSMGERDLVPAALTGCGVRALFHRLPQRPGKPLWAGVAEGGRPVLALPGNPVSVLVTARRFALAALAARAGASPSPQHALSIDDDGKRLPSGGTARCASSRPDGASSSRVAAPAMSQRPPQATASSRFRRTRVVLDLGPTSSGTDDARGRMMDA
jgi:molybdopterin molybdotransferase